MALTRWATHVLQWRLQRFIESKAIYDAAIAAGWKSDFALAFAMERDSWPDWFIDPADPIKKIGWEDGEEDV